MRPRFELVTDLVHRGDLEHALPMYQDLVKMYPGQWDFAFSYAMALLSSGHQAEAVPMLVHSIEVGPKMTPSYLVLSDILIREGKVDEAINILEQGIPVVREPELLRRQLARIEAMRKRAAGP
jgi:tetratricopeptide (TPR) repeat protein